MKLLNAAQRMYTAMLEGHSINPYEYRAVLGEALSEIEEVCQECGKPMQMTTITYCCDNHHLFEKQQS